MVMGRNCKAVDRASAVSNQYFVIIPPGLTGNLTGRGSSEGDFARPESAELTDNLTHA